MNDRNLDLQFFVLIETFKSGSRLCGLGHDLNHLKTSGDLESKGDEKTETSAEVEKDDMVVTMSESLMFSDHLERI